MKGDKNVVDKLDELLADELTAINQYMVHAEMCANWGYSKLHAAIQKRAITEMKHAENLIERILFLEGRPTVSRLNKIHIGSDVQAMHKNDLDSEISAVSGYNAAIQVCRQAGDNGSEQLLKTILKDEEEHVDWLEAQLDQIAQMGIQLYLSEQAE